mmetsp:Transcript_44061/g.68884  ORF Transcript_44061/g.68884 Transcript_44061/m.68884 type:complete len:123 (-) Transcript_44061:299-667(-)
MSVPTPTEELEMEPCCACISSDPNRKKSKEFFANERNFVHWLHMGSHLGAIATLITAIAKKDTTSTRREVYLPFTMQTNNWSPELFSQKMLLTRLPFMKVLRRPVLQVLQIRSLLFCQPSCM